MPPSLRRPLGLLLLLASLCAFASCATATTTAKTAPTSTALPASTTSAPLSPTATPGPCTGPTNNEVADYLGRVPFPNDAILSGVSQGAMDGVIRSFSFTVVTVCIPTVAPDAVDAFYREQMSARGWTQSATFPYNGNLDAACGDPYCWKMDAGNNVTLAVALENVHATDAGTLFTIRYMDYNTTDNTPATPAS